MFNVVEVPGERIIELVTKEIGTNFGLAVVDVSQSKKHIHYKTTEVYVLISGRLEVRFDDAQVRLEQFGDRVVIPPGMTHWAKSLGEQPARICVITVPAWSPQDHIVVE